MPNNTLGPPMTPEGQQILAEMREFPRSIATNANGVTLAICIVTPDALERWADRLALLLVEARQHQENKDVTTRGDDSQYDPPSARPLATAATNEPVPTVTPPIAHGIGSPAKPCGCGETGWCADHRPRIFGGR